jgi:hypothetical protein
VVESNSDHLQAEPGAVDFYLIFKNPGVIHNYSETSKLNKKIIMPKYLSHAS